MTNIYRNRWDAKSNPRSAKEYVCTLTEAVEIGDLMYWDNVTRTARPASSSDAWTGSEDGAKGKVAENLLGVARSAHAANDPNTLVRIEGRGVFAFELLTPTTFEVGDFVNAAKNPSFSLLYAQTVEKGATDASNEPTARAREISIGRIAKRSGSVTASQVLVEIAGTREAGVARPLTS